MLRLANAPCSWGVIENIDGDRGGYAQVLDEMRETGYAGTELGDWGFMRTEPAALKSELKRRKVELWGDFVDVNLVDPAAHEAGVARCVKIAKLMATVTVGNPRQPFLVLADKNGSDPKRTKHAGRITLEMGLSEDNWRIFGQGAEQIAQAVRDETGLRTVFHHHCAGYVETPDEIVRLLDLTDPDLLGLVYDTGHYAFAAGPEGCQKVVEGLDRFAERIWYVHFKDCQPDIASQARQNEWDYFEGVGQGVFCELGQGGIDFPAILAWLRKTDYEAGILVEQDVLPDMGDPKESARRNREYLASIGL